MTEPQDLQTPAPTPESPGAGPASESTPAPTEAIAPTPAAEANQVAWSSPPPQSWGQPAAPTPPPAPQAAAPPWVTAPIAAAATGAAPASSGAVMIAGVILAVAGGLLLLLGGLFVLGGAAIVGSGGLLQDTSNGDVPQGLAGAVGGFVVAFGAMFALYGILEIVAAVGVFMRREWGRFFGAVLLGIAAVLTSLAALALLGSLEGRGGLVAFVVTLLFAIAYWFGLVALARGGAAFRRT